MFVAGAHGVWRLEAGERVTATARDGGSKQGRRELTGCERSTTHLVEIAAKPTRLDPNPRLNSKKRGIIAQPYRLGTSYGGKCGFVRVFVTVVSSSTV